MSVSSPGALIHIDVKKLGRIHGGAGKRATAGIARKDRRTSTDAAGVRRLQAFWDAVHVAIDDATRLAYAEVLSDEKATTAVGFCTGRSRSASASASPSSAS
jgi:hypothetical protein